MLQKNRSHRIALFKYFLSAPLFILMLILSSTTVNNSKTIRLINKKAEWIFLKPADGTTDAKTITRFKETDVFDNEDKAKPSNQVEKKALQVTLKDTTPKNDDPVFSAVEQVPEFPGGISAFSAYLGKNVRYPADEREKGIQGRVIISFVVEKDGSLTNIQTRRGVAPGIDAEAMRVIKASPNWIPGKQNGKLVRVAYTVPIAFSLADDKSDQPTEDKPADIKGIKGTVTSIVLNKEPAAVSDSSKASTSFDINTYFNGLSPLYILDGKRVDNLNAVNPKDIESISVFKGKTAAALYGPTAANGVIVVKTKGWLKINPMLQKKN